MIKKLRKIMAITNRDEKEKKLKEYGQEVGVSLNSLYDRPWDNNTKFYEEVLIKRIHEAERSRREGRLWIGGLWTRHSNILSPVLLRNITPDFRVLKC